MINFKKVGLTALAGSLAAVSAHAGEISVSGAANVTYVTGETANSAQALGTDKDVKFSGGGELDNGWSVAVHTTMTDAFAVSSSATVITMGSMGSIGIGSGGGTNVAGAYDETYPRAYEESSDGDTSGTISNDYIGNWADDNAIVYQAPAMEIGGASVNWGVEYSFQAGSTTAADGGGIAKTNYGAGYGLGVTAAMNGLTVGVYGAERENDLTVIAGEDDVRDEFNGTWFANYAYGPVTVGYQSSYVDAGLAGTAEATTNAKTVGTSAGIFEAESMSIAFNVNDNLSVSYAETEDTYNAQDNASTAVADVKMDIESLQVAYSMGSMSIKAYKTETKNPNFDSDAASRTVTEIALGLAF
jgi:outer membrane protein OmpU